MRRLYVENLNDSCCKYVFCYTGAINTTTAQTSTQPQSTLTTGTVYPTFYVGCIPSSYLYSVLHTQTLFKKGCWNSVIFFHFHSFFWQWIAQKLHLCLQHNMQVQTIARSAWCKLQPVSFLTLAAAATDSLKAVDPGLQAAVAGCIVLTVALILVLASNVILCRQQKKSAGEI